MLKGWCAKKAREIVDGKAAHYCFRIRCIWLRIQIRRLERRIKHDARHNPHTLHFLQKGKKAKGMG